MNTDKYSMGNIKNKPWFKTENKKGEASVKIPTLTFIKFLAELDYYQTFAHGYFQIVRLQDNIIYTVEDFSDIIEISCQWLDDNSVDGRIDGIYIDQIKSAWINKTPQLFSKVNLRFLPRLIVNEIKDTCDSSYFFYTNKVIKVSKNNIEELGYRDLPGHVFKQDIINRHINLKKIQRLFNHTPYAQFIHNISGKLPHRMKAFMSAAGYLMHKHKNPAEAKAIILYDQPINELNAAHGGSGKTQYIGGISYMCHVCDLPGKGFKTSYAHKFQRVDRFTNVISLNDIQPNLKFDDLYNVISDDMTINKKYIPEFDIKFEDSPKFILASNYIIKAPEGHSTARRKYEIELSTHYGEERTIYDDFGHFFFFDWSPERWNNFSLFMMQCVQYYLCFGLIDAPAINLNERRMISEVGVELIDYLDEQFKIKTKHHKKELFKEFVTGGYVETRYKPTMKSFTVRLKKYLNYKDYNYRETPTNTKAYIEIITEDDPIHFTTINDTDHNYKTVDTSNKMTRMVNAMTDHFKDDSNYTLALDFETTGLDVHTDDAVSLALSFKPKTGYNIILPKNESKRKKLLQPLLSFLHDSNIIKVMHNAKFDLKFFNKLGITLHGEIHDIMIMDYLYDPTTKAHGLKKASKRHLNYQMVEFKQMTEDKKITEVDTETLTKYAVEDADITLQLYNFLNHKLK
jgi:hypothetical protein